MRWCWVRWCGRNQTASHSQHRVQSKLRTLWFQPVAGGLLVGLMGWVVPQSLGVVLAHQDGIHLPTAESRLVEGNRHVLQAMRAAGTLDATVTLRDTEAKTSASELSA
jgi:hypothetical protein